MEIKMTDTFMKNFNSSKEVREKENNGLNGNCPLYCNGQGKLSNLTGFGINP